MTHSMWLYPFFFFFFILQLHLSYCKSSLSSSAPNHLCPKEQNLVLLQFKQTFSIDSYASTLCDSIGQLSRPKTMSWNSSTDCCKWDGIRCDRLTGHVIGLDLSCSQLRGIIPPNSSLFQLSHLERLNLAYNDFSLSKISQEFDRLAGLTHINLSTSGFAGQISSENLNFSRLVSLDLSLNDQIKLDRQSFEMLLQNSTQLKELSLSYVKIASALPMNMSSSFTFLDLSWTGLHGSLPAKLFHLPNLQTLNLYANLNLTGYLPKVNASSNSPLKRLDLSTTRLHGEVPDSIGYLKSLNYLSVSGCEFSGAIPESFGNLTQITYLDFLGNNFSREIPSTLSSLEQLSYLDFSFNNLEGKIPNIFARLTNLRSLFLQTNNFNGPFPSSISNLSQLVKLDLSSNSLTGPIPSNIVGLDNLEELKLFDNSLNGTIPSWVFALPSLLFLHITSNRLTGPIEEFRYKSLEFIDLSKNDLQGPIPQSISQLVNLTALYLSGNNLSGNVDLNMFSSLINLQYLDLSFNNLSVLTPNTNINASLPDLIELRLSSCKMNEFPNLPRDSVNLRLIDLSYNQIDGPLPNWEGSMWEESLRYLNLTHNFIKGNLNQLPWKNLGIFDLHSNRLQGPFPSSICNLTSLEILDFSNNSFSGVLPRCLGNFSKRLTVLNMRTNRLQGTIPIAFAKGNELRNLNLHGNQLEGILPRSLVRCRYLQVVDFGNNQINDTFPEWLGNLPELQVLVLRSNRFHGSIGNTFKTKLSFPKLRIIDLSRNGFSGLLPEKYFRNFTAMMNVEEGNSTTQRYMGEEIYHDYYDYITVVMKGHEHELSRILTLFTTIDLSSNKFEGEIPNSIGHLYSLRVLNLSHNSLIGHIPPVLGNLSVLESLDLSSNELEGEIPNQLTGLTFLAVLNLSENHLVGHIPRGKQFNTFPSEAYGGNSGLCGFPLSKNCGDNDEQTPPPPSVSEEDSDSGFASGFTWKVVSMGYGSGTVFGLVMGYVVFSTGKPKWFVGLIVKKRNTRKRRDRGPRQHGRRS